MSHGSKQRGLKTGLITWLLGSVYGVWTIAPISSPMSVALQSEAHCWARPGLTFSEPFGGSVGRAFPRSAGPCAYGKGPSVGRRALRLT